MAEPTVARRPRFQPVTRRTVPEEIREALRQSIRSGELVPGSRFPSERALCEEFQVGRTTIREALQGLLTIREIERRNQRYYVTERLPTVSLAGVDPRKDQVRELFEVRRLLEDAAVRRCVERASSAEIDAIAEVALTFSPSMPLADFRKQDREFHWAIARASHNGMLLEVYGKVLETLFRSEAFSSLLGDKANTRTVRRIIRESGNMHRKIADAVINRDLEAAASAAEEHLDEVEQLMVQEMV
jgi:GntR family transcriptional regulator, transcriptional repressor for pyruvate dehydrogenase complex